MNSCTLAAEKLKCDTLDGLFNNLRRMRKRVQGPLRLLKADIDAAYRRIPIRDRHLEYGYVVFLYQGTPMISGHLAMPFGAVASVHNWDRIGYGVVSLLCVRAGITLIGQAPSCALPLGQS